MCVCTYDWHTCLVASLMYQRHPDFPEHLHTVYTQSKITNVLDNTYQVEQLMYSIKQTQAQELKGKKRNNRKKATSKCNKNIHNQTI